MSEVNLEHVRVWYEDLRVARYGEQGRSQLAKWADGAGWRLCCLGVASCSAGFRPTTDEEQFLVDDDGDGDGELGTSTVDGLFRGGQEYLPPEVVEWLGVDGDNPVLKVPERLQGREGTDGGGLLGEAETCSDLNDAYELTFEEIAECVYETWLKGSS